MNYYSNQAAFASGTIAERWSYAYDEYGRKSVARRSVANGSNVLIPVRDEATIYDTRNRITAEGSLAYTFDNLGRMSSVAVRSANVALTAPAERITSYTYDILGRLASVKEDASPAVTTDPTLNTNYTFDLQGRADKTQLPGGVTTDYNFDQLGRLDTQTDSNATGQVLASYDYKVRADGKRTDLDETTWFDTNTDGVRQTSEVKATSYDWTYDPVGRLTDEAITHFDIFNNISQSEHFEYDLTGNRTRLDRNLGNDSTIDEVITYGYDANDRLITEVLDALDNSKDQTTTYDYNNTQQTSKLVTRSVSEAISSQRFTYNLQGRISTTINEGFTSGTLSSRERTSYQYDSSSYRISLATETGTTLSPLLNTENWQLKTSTSFLADSHNHTGYKQTIRDTTINADGSSKTIDYTFGQDEISQRTVLKNTSGVITQDETLIFGHDGHGSVRVLTDLAGVINQVIAYACLLYTSPSPRD